MKRLVLFLLLSLISPLFFNVAVNELVFSYRKQCVLVVSKRRKLILHAGDQRMMNKDHSHSSHIYTLKQ